MDMATLFRFGIAAAGKAPDKLRFASDLAALYGVARKVEAAGKFDSTVMVKDGSLPAVVEALERTLGVVDAMLKDPADAPIVADMLATVGK